MVVCAFGAAFFDLAFATSFSEVVGFSVVAAFSVAAAFSFA